VLWWSYVPEKKLLRQPHAGEPRRLVLMKGFPGRAGIALAGHAEQNPSYMPDTDLRYLSSLIGEADLQAYVQWGVIAR
jgi:hypothetical protein